MEANAHRRPLRQLPCSPRRRRDWLSSAEFPRLPMTSSQLSRPASSCIAPATAVGPNTAWGEHAAVLETVGKIAIVVQHSDDSTLRTRQSGEQQAINAAESVHPRYHASVIYGYTLLFFKSPCQVCAMHEVSMPCRNWIYCTRDPLTTTSSSFTLAHFFHQSQGMPIQHVNIWL